MSELPDKVADPTVFRAVMRKLAASVTVITTFSEGRPHGMTATAVCSVCADPPTLLVVVNRTARTHPMIDKSGVFVVNILSETQRPLADRFASKRDDPFADLVWQPGPERIPILEGAAAHLECSVVERSRIGTHTLFIGRVMAGDVGAAWPLMYHDGRYTRLANETDAAA